MFEYAVVRMCWCRGTFIWADRPHPHFLALYFPGCFHRPSIFPSPPSVYKRVCVPASRLHSVYLPSHPPVLIEIVPSLGARAVSVMLRRSHLRPRRLSDKACLFSPPSQLLASIQRRFSVGQQICPFHSFVFQQHWSKAGRGGQRRRHLEEQPSSVPQHLFSPSLLLFPPGPSAPPPPPPAFTSPSPSICQSSGMDVGEFCVA